MTTVEELRKKIESQKGAGGKTSAIPTTKSNSATGSTVQSLRERAKSLPSQNQTDSTESGDWGLSDVAMGAFRAGEQIPETTGNLLGFLGEGLGLQAQEWGFNKVGTALREGGKAAQKVGKEITEAGMNAPVGFGTDTKLSEKQMQARKISGSIGGALMTGGASLGSNLLGTGGRAALGTLDVLQGGIPGLGGQAVTAWTKAPASITNPVLNATQKLAGKIGRVGATATTGVAQGMIGAAASKGTETTGTDLAVGAGVGSVLSPVGSFLLGKGANIGRDLLDSRAAKSFMDKAGNAGRVIETNVGKIPMKMWSYLDHVGQQKVAHEIANMVGVKTPKAGSAITGKLQDVNIAMDAIYKHVVDNGDGVLAKNVFDFAGKFDDTMEASMKRVSAELDRAGEIIDNKTYDSLLEKAKKSLSLSKSMPEYAKVQEYIEGLRSSFGATKASDLNNLANNLGESFKSSTEKNFVVKYQQELYKAIKDYIVENGARSVPGLQDTRVLSALHSFQEDVAKMAKKHAGELGAKEGLIQSTTNSYVMINALKTMAGDPAALGNLQTSLALKIGQKLGAADKTMNTRLLDISDMYHTKAKSPDLEIQDVIDKFNYQKLQERTKPTQFLLPAARPESNWMGDITSKSKIVNPTSKTSILRSEQIKTSQARPKKQDVTIGSSKQQAEMAREAEILKEIEQKKAAEEAANVARKKQADAELLASKQKKASDMAKAKAEKAKEMQKLQNKNRKTLVPKK